MPDEVEVEVELESDVICVDCNVRLRLKACLSNAGWYPGYFCDNDGPYDRLREYGYFATEQEAQDIVDGINAADV